MSNTITHSQKFPNIALESALEQLLSRRVHQAQHTSLCRARIRQLRQICAWRAPILRVKRSEFGANWSWKEERNNCWKIRSSKVASLTWSFRRYLHDSLLDLSRWWTHQVHSLLLDFLQGWKRPRGYVDIFCIKYMQNNDQKVSRNIHSVHNTEFFPLATTWISLNRTGRNKQRSEAFEEWTWGINSAV